ncbi:MAG: DMT family transporter [Rhodospirillaceae bacterium]|jgi:drug/metabolite transporter (DMT)-like permease|nr:DMT family transporter [Rhodospirillaceae bacterium]MBT6204758.1 DMT family transporter [Rhodospirillaceae bacterium]MBT6511558.1 DMT family transporter [Rhodospirillaceae bacterium]MBT7613227.1 DMT family transporter [Rhodospirillaceae bacterium]MBT7646523.1 DMT family transporter [Rhodospirillaceae bacterium]
MTRRALLLLAVLALVWGATWPIMKVAVLGLEPWTFRTYCGVLGGIGMLCVARMNGHRLMMAPDQLRLAVLIAPFSLGGWFVFSALGVGLMGSGRAAIIAYTMPLWAMIFARLLLKESLTPARIISLAAGLCGLAVLLSHDFGLIEDSPMGAAFMVMAALVWGLGTVLFKRATWREPLSVIVAWQLIAISVPVTIMALLTEKLFPAAGIWTWLALAYNVVLSTVVGYYVWNRIVLLLPTGAAVIGSMAVPITGVMFGTLLLGEEIGWREIIALALIAGAITVVMLEKPKLKGAPA